MIASLGLSTPAAAQVAGGMLRGAIMDSSGASIARGLVSVTNINTGVKRTATTNEAGSYAVPNLLPGSYEVTGSAVGFASETKSGVEVEVGTELLLDFKLSVSQRKDVVEVSAQPTDVLQSTTSDLTGFTDGGSIQELPLNGRSWTDLALLEPGVTNIRDLKSPSARGLTGFGNEVAISGARPTQNNYRMDGISLNDYANSAPGSVLGGNLGADAVAEFSVVTSNAPAEYSKTSGGVINSTTRSGTNVFHGDVYEFVRNNALDARNFFDRSNLPPFKRNQFGAALGGPIQRDRTFFFVNYEGIRQSKGSTTISTVPTQDPRNGILHNADGSVTKIAVDPGAQKYLTFWPLPNAGAAPNGLGNIGLLDFVSQEVTTEDFVIARVDHRFSDRDSIFGTYMYDRTPDTVPDPLDTVLTKAQTSRQIAVLEESHNITSAIVNSLRIGLNRDAVVNAVPTQALNPAAADPSYAAVPGATAAKVSISGLTGFGGGLQSGGSYYAWTSKQLNDDLFWIRGRHSIKAGVAIELMQMNILNFTSPSGSYSFGSLSDFLTNHPSTYEAALPGHTTPRGFRVNMFGGYVQDDWRASSGFTVNLGLRYEMSTVPTEEHGLLTALQNPASPSPHLGSPFFQNPTLTNFEPRVGFAWSDPFHIAKTVLRGGFGIYDVLPLPYEFSKTEITAAPFAALGNVTATGPLTGTFFTGAEALLGPESLRGGYVQQNPRRNYVLQWNLNLQREIVRKLTAVVAYVGSRAVHQPWISDEYDLVMPTFTPEGLLWPSPVGSGSRINPNFGNIRGMMWPGNSEYHGLQLGLRKTLSRGLQLQASYTWSKSIDDNSTSLDISQLQNAIATPYFDLRRGRAVSDFNVPQLLVVNGIWQVPGPKSSSGALNWVAGGWQFGTILQASDGIPFTATFSSSGDPLGSSGLSDFPNRLIGPGCSTLTNPGNATHFIKTQCFAIPVASPALLPLCDARFGTPPQCFNLMGNAGRNILMAPGVVNLDFSLFKNMRIPGARERFNVQFRAELFNAVNHTNFAPPASGNDGIFDSHGVAAAAAGLLTSTLTDSRQIQFGLKIRW